MSASVSDIQRRLGGPNASDETYRRLLQELLTHQDLKPYIHGLQETDLQGFVELLDEVNEANTHTHSVLTRPIRPSTASRSLTISFAKFCVGCRAYVATTGSSLYLISSRAKTFRREEDQLRLEISVTHMKRNSAETKFASKL